ncbi:molybdopterin-dependent oxidoreductase [Marinobacteraceae bacterium S3BR75-40.1]
MSDVRHCHTTCPYCGVGCGLRASVRRGRIEALEGDRAHPANHGRLCIKGSSLEDTLGSQGRLLYPEVNGRTVDWDSALNAVADGLGRVRRRYGGDALGFYLSGQLLTEDYYVANKFAKGFLGTPHVDTNSRLCMSSAVASYKRAFGADAVPGCYEDLELADLLVLVGSNAAWNHPVLFQRMKQAGEERPGRRVVVIDPRRTATCEIADLHLPIRPGSDGVLFNGLLAWLAERELVDQDYIAAHTHHFDSAVEAARQSAPDPASVAQQCDVPLEAVLRFFHWFADTPRTLTFYSQGINQAEAGTDQGNAIINVHLATGRVGRPGASPFSITGQPNAMGGREVGGLANQLAAHMDYDSPGARQRVADFWQAPALPQAPGLKAVDLFEAVHDGRIQAIWIMATNPVVSLPNADRVRAALERCPLVIVSDCFADSDTLALADIRLPAMGWSEKDGTVTNSERRISRQSGLLPPVGEARADWWIMTEVARRMGYGAAFDYHGPHAIFDEHARLSGLENQGARAFDISALAGLSAADYDRLQPVQWPCTPEEPGGRARLFGDSRFCTPDGRARFVPVAPRAPDAVTGRQQVRVNTGRLRDQWHTMTRTGRAPRLLQHQAEPSVTLHPVDAAEFGVATNDLVRLVNGQGEWLGRARLDDGQRRGEVFLPIHWTAQFTARARTDVLVPPRLDPLSGQPAFKHAQAELQRWPARWHGLLLRRSPDSPVALPEYWARYPLEYATAWRLGDLQAWNLEACTNWLGDEPQIVLQDPAGGYYRAAFLNGGRLEAVLLIGPTPDFPETAWLDGLFDQSALGDAERRALLAGRPSDAEEVGAIVCACFQVGERTIQQAVGEGHDSVEALGEQLQCGTNCGSCLPELRALLERAPSDV